MAVIISHKILSEHNTITSKRFWRYCFRCNLSSNYETKKHSCILQECLKKYNILYTFSARPR